MGDQTREELEQHLVDTLEFMQAANERFDAGRVQWAKQLAVHIRLLVHHTKNSHALLEQLDVRTRWGWLDAASDINPRNLAATPGPVAMSIEQPAEGQPLIVNYQPDLGSVPSGPGRRLRRFPGWWQRPIVRDLYKNEFTREEIVLAVANKDGGAHVDRRLPARLDNLKNGASLGHLASLDSDGNMQFGVHANLVETDTPVPALDSELGIDLVRQSPIPALIRQFSYEVIETVRERAPEIFARVPLDGEPEPATE
ncbi:hypothetical protein [Microbacterium saperdae]|nr:hypothetical protein [Microbacterium saperdae]